MHPARRFLSLPVALLVVSTATAQQPTTYPKPLLKSVFPPGGQAGTVVEVTVDGADLDDATALFFSSAKLRAERVPDPPADPKKKNAPPPPTKFKVTLPADTPPGLHDVRVVGKWGISNPRAFAVGTAPEIVEKEPNSDVPEARPLPLGTVVNGVISSKTDVDYYAFTAMKGQKVVAHCAASSIDGRLSAYLQVFAGNREIASNRAYRDGDAVVSCTLPADGDYLIRVSDFAYQAGGPESVYRLVVSTAPWIDTAYPAVLPAGKPSRVTLFGRNLPGGKPVPGYPGREQTTVTVTPPAAPEPFPGRLLPRVDTVDGFGYRLAGSNPVFLGLADAPVVLDNDDNDLPEKAQPVAVPADVCGRFERRGDRDYFAFTAKKGDVVVIEGYADRLRSPIDLTLSVRAATDGRVIGAFDTHPDVPTLADQFYTYTDDPFGKITIPADGTYHLLVRSQDAAARVALRDTYCVSLRKEHPDFRLVVVGNHDNGAGLTLPRGSSQSVQVVCFRHDGFEGEIALAAHGLPAGVTCEPQTFGPKLQTAVLVLRTAADAKDWAGPFTVTGTATVDGKKVVRTAAFGCLVYPARNNQPAVSRMARSLCLAVREAGPFRLSHAQKELAIPIGGTGTVKLKVVKQQADFKDPVNVTLSSGPAQSNGRLIGFGQVNIAPDKDADLQVKIPTNAPPGRYTLVFRGSGKYALGDPTDKKKKKRNTQYAAVSAPVAVTVYDTACELALGQARVALPPGSTFALPVKLTRLHGYTGEFTVELSPSNAQNISAASVKVPAGASETKLLLKAAKGAKPVREVKFLVRASARVGNATLRTETELVGAIDDAAKPGSEPGKSKTIPLLAASAIGWKYATGLKGNAWQKPDFDDKGWKTVKALFGNGEPEIVTRKGTEVPEKGTPLYCRRAFDVPAEVLKRKGVTVRLKVASDNSAVVTLNGTVADADSGDHEFSYWNRDVEIPVSRLKAGRNVIAVKVENLAGSSDVYLDLAVVGLVPLPEKASGGR